MDFQSIINGDSRGLLPSLARSLLAVASGPYGWAVALRNQLFDRGWKGMTDVGLPVISIGNITAGGTGKTPLVEWVCEWLQRQQLRPGIISRGYGAQKGRLNDEALELAMQLPHVPHVQNPDRVAAARRIRLDHNPQVLVLDDAFQHRRVQRDLDVVVIDATQPFGHNWLLPRGLLREPLSSLKRADLLVLSRADTVDQGTRNQIKQHVARFASAPWVEVAHRPRPLQNSAGARLRLDSLTGRRIAAFCAVGNPRAFRRTLEQAGADVVDLRVYADHHRYDAHDRQALGRWIQSLNVEQVVCTRKDLVKLPDVVELDGVPLYALPVQLEVLRGNDVLESMLRQVTGIEFKKTAA